MFVDLHSRFSTDVLSFCHFNPKKFWAPKLVQRGHFENCSKSLTSSKKQVIVWTWRKDVVKFEYMQSRENPLKRRGVAFEFSEKEALPLTHKFSTIPIYKEKPCVGLIDLNFKSILKRKFSKKCRWWQIKLFFYRNLIGKNSWILPVGLFFIDQVISCS